MFPKKTEDEVEAHIWRRVDDPDFDARVGRSNRTLLSVTIGVSLLLITFFSAYFLRHREISLAVPVVCSGLAFQVAAYAIESRDRAWYAAVCVKLLRKKCSRDET